MSNLNINLSLQGTPVYPLELKHQVGTAQYYQARASAEPTLLVLLNPEPGEYEATLSLLGGNSKLRRITLTAHRYSDPPQPEFPAINVAVLLESPGEFQGLLYTVTFKDEVSHAQVFIDRWLTWALTGRFEPGGFLSLTVGE